MTTTSPFPWPAHCEAAISLTFDDGLVSQREVAVPLLNRFNLQGTFYINPGKRFVETLAPWQAAAAAGHELGNHTVHHPCAKNFSFMGQPDRQALNDMTLVEMEQEIVEAGRRIHQLVPHQKATSFAYPCYETYVGQGATRQSYVPLVARHCIAGRGRGEYANDPHYCDPAHLWSWPCERMSGAELVGLVEEAIEQHRWGILTFHGINEGGLTIGDRDLETLCRHLDRHRQRIWTAPIATIAQRVIEWKAH